MLDLSPLQFLSSVTLTIITLLCSSHLRIGIFLPVLSHHYCRILNTIHVGCSEEVAMILSELLQCLFVVGSIWAITFVLSG